MPTKKRRPVSQRNAELYRTIIAGEKTKAEVARSLGISSERVGQIFRSVQRRYAKEASNAN